LELRERTRLAGGIVARLAAEAVGVDGRVAALDLNPAMLAVASELPAVVGAPIEWVEGMRRRCRSQRRALTLSAASSGFSSFPIENTRYAR
jgi:ubiquinone/menaquinone biosynthesis C-methylase UbiE